MSSRHQPMTHSAEAPGSPPAAAQDALHGPSLPAGAQRYHGLDAARGVLMMLGIALHASMFYMAEPPAAMPMPVDRNNSYFFDIIMQFIHVFRMPTFFLLAGFFTAQLVEDRGLRKTYSNRAARILYPLLAAAVLVNPFVGLFMLDFMLVERRASVA